MDSLRKSLKSYGSHKYPSSRTSSFDLNEEQPILVDRDDGERREVVVKIDGNSHNPFESPTPAADLDAATTKVWREGSYDFWKEADGKNETNADGNRVFSFKNRPNQSAKANPSATPMAEISEDPPSLLIGSFLHKQKASGGEMALDMDLEMEELKKPSSTTSSTYVSKDLRVSFQDPSAHNPSVPSHNRSSSSSSDDEHHPRVADQVIRCTSNSSFAHASTLHRAKTRSRLIDPPPPPPSSSSNNEDKRSDRGMPTKSGQLKSGMLGKSGQLKSGMLGKPGPYDDDDEDPFLDEDVPDDFNRPKFDTLTILQWLSLILILAALTCSLTIPRLEQQKVWRLHLWKWELLVLVLICGRLVSGWLIRIVVFFIERNFLLRKRVLYFVYGVRKAVQNCLWLGLVLISWQCMFDKKVEQETQSKTLPYVTKVLFCLLVATLLRLVKTLLLKVLASAFHVSTYFDRIQDALFNQYVIETLSGPPLVEIQQSQYEEERMISEMQKLQSAGATIPNDLRATAFPSKSSGQMRKSGQIGKSIRFSGSVSKKDISRQQQDEEVITVDQLHKLNQQNISAWNMKRLMRIVRYGTLTTLDEQVSDVAGEDESAMQIRSEYEAKIAAKRIFNNVAKHNAKYIYLPDLLRFMRQEEALKTMSLFEGAQEKNRVSKKSLKNWVVNAFRERKALALTLNDTKTAVNTLHQMANIVVGIIVFALWLLILGLATTHFFVFLSSQLLLAVFVFGNTLKTVFEAIIFLFVMHPFDVGDRCEVEGVQMIVEEMNIMTTIFLRYDNLKIYYPNSVLSGKAISNFYRSPDMGESIDFCIHVATPVEKLAIMKERIIRFMENKKEHWYPSPSVVLRDVDDMNRLKVSIWMRHRINYQDMGMRWERRELVVQEMIRVLRELEIEYRMLPLDVNVRDMPPVTSTRVPSTWSTFN
ncbi:mechanosensitive ion channel protein 6-like [Typha angustifolia]|uniref:mechanosensitive ion channel protein 6-like n=1 Tax=Typha angustifolia TaxID=59011 RepID=UPI003C2AD543